MLKYYFLFNFLDKSLYMININRIILYYFILNIVFSLLAKADN